MSWLQKVFGLELRSGESTLIRPSDLLLQAFGYAPSKAGVSVTPQTAIRNMAVWGAVQGISNTMGFLPAHVMERIDGGGSKKATGYPHDYLLHDRPNPYMSSIVFRETLQAHLLLWGNAYAEVEWGANGFPKALWPLLPSHVRPEMKGNQLAYQVILPDGTQTSLMPWDVLHIPGLGFDGIRGYSPITLAREAVGLGLAAEEYAARFYSNGYSFTGILEHPGLVNKEAQDRLRAQLDQVHGGLTNKHRALILEQGMKYAKMMPMRDAQFLEGRQYQRSEIGLLYRVPPHWVGDVKTPTFNSLEQFSLELATYTFGHWIARWEQELNYKLLSAQARKRFFHKIDVRGLLKGDFKTRMEGYRIARAGGWLSGDDIRELEDMPPIPDGNGQGYWQPVNVKIAGEPEPEPAPRANLAPPGSDQGGPNDGNDTQVGAEE